MQEHATHHKHRRRRAAPFVWIGGLAAASILVLAVNGTLSTWTTAIIDNSTNQVNTAGSVRLLETAADGTTVCDTGTADDNALTAGDSDACTTINKYGGTAADPDGVKTLAPGDSITSTVTLTNTGTGTGDLALTAGACTTSGGQYIPADPDATPDPVEEANDACGQVEVQVSCSPAYTIPATPGTATVKVTQVDLDGFDAAASSAIAALAKDQSTDCTFTVSLPSTTSSNFGGQVSVQPVTWTLQAI